MPDEYVKIDGQMYKKPTKGRCAYCGSDMLEFYDDGTGICLNCGRTFSWLKPLKEPVKPQVSSAAPAAAAAASTSAPRKTKPAPAPAALPVRNGVLSAKVISILGLIGGLLIGIGAIMIIAILPMGSWPPEDFDSETLGNIMKGALLVWATGTMLFLMAGFASAGTDELDPSVRRTLISASVALAILSVSLWIGMRFMGGGP